VGPSSLPATHFFPFNIIQQVVELQFFFVNLPQDVFSESEPLLQKSDIGFKSIDVSGLSGFDEVISLVFTSVILLLFFNASILTTCTTFLLLSSVFKLIFITSINIIKANINITPIKIFKTLFLEKSIFFIYIKVYIKVYIKLNILYIYIYMAKSHKTRSSRRSRSSRKTGVLKSLKKTTSKAVPMVKSGLKSVGSTVKTVAIKSAPTVNKGLEGVYGALATGFDMGIKGVSKGVSKVSKMAKKSRSSNKSKRGGTSRKY